LHHGASQQTPFEAAKTMSKKVDAPRSIHSSQLSKNREGKLMYSNMYNETKRREGKLLPLSKRLVDVTASPFVMQQLGLDSILCVNNGISEMTAFEQPKPKIPVRLNHENKEFSFAPKVVLEKGNSDPIGSTFLTQSDGDQSSPTSTEDRLPKIDFGNKGLENCPKNKLSQQLKESALNSTSPGTKDKRSLGLFPAVGNALDSLPNASPTLAGRKMRPKHERMANMLDQVLKVFYINIFLQFFSCLSLCTVRIKTFGIGPGNASS
jgi:hypothetical protein